MRKPFLQPQQSSEARQTTLPETREILSVSQVNRKVKKILEGDIGSVWIKGELSNFIKATSGHWYFTLKDSSAQIKCALFKFKNTRVDFNPQEGDKVVVKGKISLYEARGDYQLIADFMEPAGLGNLQRQLNETINKLKSEGLFDSKSKYVLPKYPKQIGVITSSTGAAIHDVLTVLKRRCPMIPVIIYPTQVQGVDASRQIIDALNEAELRNECDVILITRGGGSLEDLWSFNDEQLARTIANYSIPTIAAIGHEVDTTITELVADLRAATPSAAAELLSPEQNTLAQQIDILGGNLISNIQLKISLKQQQLQFSKIKLIAPEKIIQTYQYKIEKIKQQLFSRQTEIIKLAKDKLTKKTHQLELQDPKQKLNSKKLELNNLNEQLIFRFKLILNSNKNKLAELANQLNLLSPLSTLARGYTITRERKTGRVLNKISDFNQGQAISILLSDGELNAKIE
ncbi:MAG: exodeoxyribonuclease VII large subunit [Polaribacter sp.]|jgi:exodeoxyribonuclease VII large subunit